MISAGDAASSIARIVYGLNEYISSPCIVVSFATSATRSTQPTVKPIPRRPSSFPIVSFRRSASIRDTFSLHDDTWRVQL